MPIPKRRKGESTRDFLRRGHEALADEYPDPKQRHAILMGQVSKSDGQLEEGIGVEMEHTTSPLVAAKIALDHLREDPYYYVKLRALEGRTIDKIRSSVLQLKQEGNMSEVDGSVRKAIEGVKVLARAVRKAAFEEGHVSHRSDGDYKKTGGQWVKLPAAERQGQAGPGGAPEPKAPGVKSPTTETSREEKNVLSWIQNQGRFVMFGMSDSTREIINSLRDKGLVKDGQLKDGTKYVTLADPSVKHESTQAWIPGSVKREPAGLSRGSDREEELRSSGDLSGARAEHKKDALKRLKGRV